MVMYRRSRLGGEAAESPLVEHQWHVRLGVVIERLHSTDHEGVIAEHERALDRAVDPGADAVDHRTARGGRRLPRKAVEPDVLVAGASELPAQVRLGVAQHVDAE